MNPFFPQQKHLVHSEASISRRPSKKVPIAENFGSMTDDLTTTLFLGDLSVICDEIKLYELFCRFGFIESVQLKKSDRDPQRAHLGFGFIKFVSPDSAERALQEMNGYFFLGRAMRVGWALEYGKKAPHALAETFPNARKGQTAQIHVMFVTRELNRRVSELDLGAAFNRFGNLVDIAIKKNCINTGYGVQSGYAFLHFASTAEGLRSAITAVEEGNLLLLDNITYQCKVTHSLQVHLTAARQKEEEKLEKRYRPPSPIHNLPISFDDSNLVTYYSHAQGVSPKSFTPSTVHKYHEKDFLTYNISPKMTMSRSELSYEVLPPSLSPNLHYLNSVETNEPNPPFSNTTDLLYPSFTVNNDTSTYTSNSISQQYFYNNSHHLNAKHFSSSLTLSPLFINSTDKDPSMKKN